MSDANRQRILDLLFSGDDSNIQLGFQLEKTLKVDLSDFWHDLQEIYELLYSSRNIMKRELLSCAYDGMSVTVGTTSRFHRDGVNPNNQFLNKVYELRLQQNCGTALPDWIGGFSNIAKLYWSGYELTSLPDSMRQLKNLRTLHLFGQRMPLPDWIGELDNLCVLRASGMGLTSLPESLQQLDYLFRLELAHNDLTVLPDWLWKMPNLCTVDLRNNPRLLPIPQEVLDDPETPEVVL